MATTQDNNLPSNQARTHETSLVDKNQAKDFCSTQPVNQIGSCQTDSAMTLLRQLENEIRFQCDKLSGVEIELCVRDSRIAELLADINARDGKIEELRLKLDGARADRDRVDHALMAADDRISKLQRALTSSKLEIEQLTAGFRKTNRSISGKVLQSQGFEARRSIAQANSQDLGSEHWQPMKANKGSSEYHSESAGSEHENAMLGDELRRRLENPEYLKRKVKSLSEELTRLRKLIQIRDAQIETMNVELNKRDQIIASLKNELDIEKQRSQQFTRPDLELRKETTSDESRNDLHHARLKALSEQLVTSEHENELLRSRLEEVCDHRDRLETQRLQSDARTVESDAKIEKMRAKIERLEAELAAQCRRIGGLQSNARGDSYAVNFFDVGEQPLDYDLDSGILNEIFSSSDDIVPIHAQRMIVARDIGDGEPERYSLTKKITTIGRAPKSDIRINNKYISRQHARIVMNDSVVIIEDMSSTNGFAVNSEDKKWHQLQHGDRLCIGAREFEYVDHASVHCR